MGKSEAAEGPANDANGSRKPSLYLRAQLCIIVFAVLVRFCVATHSYSGMHVKPTFGDYEAQRHWMEVTTNLPPTEWYKHGPKNNLSYWGLDYPPLSGYQSWLCGKFIALFEPPAVALISSQGYETLSSKNLMRITVILSDLLCYLTACLACAALLYKTPNDRLSCLIAMAINPALIIIDHGHFQYNGISLGCAAAAVAVIVNGQSLLGSLLFCASLSHKQMSLYLAPAFFAHLLGYSLHKKGWIATLASIGIVVIGSFAVMWAPFLKSIDDILTVLGRIFPTQRGLFEDYVANFWCVSSLVIKWKRLIKPQFLFRMCTGATLAAFLPSVVAEITSPSPIGFLLCLANTAFSFFMFSFQVHEKSILIPLLPITMLGSTIYQRGPLGPSLMHSAMLSMYPLLEKDGLQDAYLGLLLIHLGISCLLWRSVGDEKIQQRSQKKSLIASISALRSPWSQSPSLSLLILTIIHIIRASIVPPPKYPYLWDALMVSWAFLNFIEAFAYLYTNQLLKRKV